MRTYETGDENISENIAQISPQKVYLYCSIPNCKDQLEDGTVCVKDKTAYRTTTLQSFGRSNLLLWTMHHIMDGRTSLLQRQLLKKTQQTS
jgi:hypothetical protein